MTRKMTFLLWFCLLLISTAYGQQGSLKGTVNDASTGKPLIGANVVLLNTTLGSAAGLNGNFKITNVPPGNYTAKVTYLGYSPITKKVTIVQNQEAVLNIKMHETYLLGNQVVITASRKPEKLTKAPATIDLMTAKNIEKLTINPGDLLARQMGVDYVRTGVEGMGINIRGFNSAFNIKNLQMNDNRLATLIATSLPLGSMGTITKDDIDHVEIVLGPAGTLYGPNADNGVINTITKDPRYSQGLTVAVAGGNQSTWSGRIRYAKVLSKKFAFKVTGSYAQGIDFRFTDSVYVGTKGYPEFNLDRRFNHLKLGTGLYYTFKPGYDIILTYGHSNSNNLGVTNAGRNQIKDWKIDILQVRFTSPHIFAQLYQTWSNTANTYALHQRTSNYYSFLNAGFSQSEAAKRSFTEAWYGTSPSTGIALNRNAVFKDASRRWNGEFQYNNTFGGLNIITGVQWQQDHANSEHTYLLDANGPIVLNQYGVYAQLEYSIPHSGLKLIAAARGDDHDLYGFNFIPKAGISYSGKAGNFRVTYGKGIAAPSILNLSANIFGGLLLGNGEGFTLSNGKKIPKLVVETINSFEAGYKKLVNNKLYINADVYYNISQHFLSPATNIADAAHGVFVTKRGDTPIQNIVAGTPAVGSPFVLTYLNYGKVNTYGADIDLKYYLNKNLTFVFNYSYFNFSLNKNDMENDGNGDGVVTKTDIPINTPKNKLGFGVNATYNKFFGSIFGRWVEAYDFFSGIAVAASTNKSLTWGGSPVVENERVGSSWNYGPLGGFVNFDITAGYSFTKQITLTAAVTNLFNAKEQQFALSPFIRRLVSVQLQFNLK